MAADPPDDGTVEELEPETSDVQETDDGGAIVQLDNTQKDAPPVDEEFYRNLAESDITEAELSTICEELLKKIDFDKEARKKRDKDYEDAIKRTGLGDDAPGGASFEGASKVVHPLLTEACVDFASRAISELMPANGPAKEFIPGTATKERVEKAKRKVTYLNYQFKIQMRNFRSELEQLLTQLPLGGSQFLRIIYDERRKRPVPQFIPIDDVYLPYAANDYYTADRVTFVEHITEFEFKKRVKDGLYRDLELTPPAQAPEPSGAQKATEKIEGNSPNPYNEDGLRDIYETQVSLEIEDFGLAPYRVALDPANKKILSLVRNWEEDDELLETMYWMIKFPFVPWRGAYDIGLNQMMAGIPAATTGALRALLDSAHINNMPTLLRLKGANFSGQSKEFSVATVTEVEGGIAGDDIRKLIMQIPYSETSMVLYQLLGFLVDAGKGVVKTTFEDLSDGNNPNIPVGTTLALIEQGMKVMSAIHLRLWQAMDHVIQVVDRINRMYVTDEEIKGETGELMAKRSDFQKPIDAIPTANPEVFSDVQRFAQMQMVSQRAAMVPQLYDLRKVEELILKQTKIPDATDLLIPQQVPQWMNAVNENAAATLARPIAAFPEQDHLAHIQVHMDYLKSPFFGSSPLIAPSFLPGMLNHLKEHISLWYVNFVYKAVTQAAGTDLGDLMAEIKDPATRVELDQTLASASEISIRAGEKAFSKLPPVIEQAMQLVQQLSPPPLADPSQATLEKAKIDAASRDKAAQMRSQDAARRDQVTASVTQLKTKAEMDKEALRQEREDQRTGAKEQSALGRETMQQEAETLRSRERNASDELRNREDNITALEIASAEVKSGEKIAIENGTGINPKPE